MDSQERWGSEIQYKAQGKIRISSYMGFFSQDFRCNQRVQDKKRYHTMVWILSSDPDEFFHVGVVRYSEVVPSVPGMARWSTSQRGISPLCRTDLLTAIVFPYHNKAAPCASYHTICRKYRKTMEHIKS